MNLVNQKKLPNSKWTAVRPLNREKHFLVIKVLCDEAGNPSSCILEAIHSHREIQLAWRELKDDKQWQIGWQT